MAKIIAMPQQIGDFVVESGISQPKKGRCFKYPFGKMEVGQSFAFDGGMEAAQRVRSAACVYGKRRKLKFSIYKNDDGEYRCWRIK